MTTTPNRAALAWAVAGATLIAYPVLRPWGSEADPQTFASIAWPVSHALAMVGFLAIAFALRLTGSRAEVPMWVAVALLLPYYGAEAYGLHALGQHAAEHGDPAVLAVADEFRYAVLPGSTFVLGLLVLAGVGVLIAREHRTIGGVLVAAGLVTYLPQFFGPAGLRIFHGVVLGAGLLLAGQMSRRSLAQRVSS